jgi:predicted TIM-barrel fold metal-dependent hydrolase
MLGATAAGMLGPATADLQASEEQPMAHALPIVDTHQHLWDLSKLRLSWLKGSGALNRSYVMKDYLEATAGLNVVKSVYMEVDVDDDCQVAEAEYILDICRRGDAPTCAAVIGGRPGSPGFREYITRYKGNRYIKGVRQVLFAWKEGSAFFLDKTYVDSVRLLGELGMSFDICVAAPGLADAAKLVDLCPDTRFILDHCGNADVKQFYPAEKYPSPEKAEEARRFADRWRRDIAEMAKRKSVICKISGIVASVPRQWSAEDLAPIINHCLDSFGPDRVVFGGDWPVCTKGATYRQWVEALRQVIRPRSQTEQRKLLSENAIQFYGLM